MYRYFHFGSLVHFGLVSTPPPPHKILATGLAAEFEIIKPSIQITFVQEDLQRNMQYKQETAIKKSKHKPPKML